MVTTADAGNADGKATEEAGVAPVPVVPVPAEVSPPTVAPAAAGVVPVPAFVPEAVFVEEPPPPHAPRRPAAITAAMIAATGGWMAERFEIMRSPLSGEPVRKATHGGKKIGLSLSLVQKVAIEIATGGQFFSTGFSAYSDV